MLILVPIQNALGKENGTDRFFYSSQNTISRHIYSSTILSTGKPNPFTFQDSAKRVQIKISAKEIPEVYRAPQQVKDAQTTRSPKRIKKKSLTAGTKLRKIQLAKKYKAPAIIPQYADRDSNIEKLKSKLDELSALVAKDINSKTSEKSEAVAINKKLVSQSKATNWLGVLMALLIAGLAYLLFLYQQKSRAAKLLARQNSEYKNNSLNLENHSKHLSELNDLKDKLFAIVGHDLRSPIGNLRAVMELFQTEGMSVKEIGDILKEMLPSVENADLILYNLLNWAVSQMDGIKLNKSDFSYYAIVEETVKAFTYLLKSKQIEFKNEVVEDVFVFADIDHVRVIVRNLMSNAVKFAPEGGKIRFYNTFKGDNVVLAVEDNGKGLSEVEISNLFVNKTHFTKHGTKGEKGAGIGLMLCQEMAELNQGKISVVSNQGENCTFFLELPEGKDANPVILNFPERKYSHA